MSEYEETYYMVPAYIRKLPGMTLGYMDVYNIMFQFWNKGRQCFISNGELIRRTGYTQQYLNNAFVYFEGLSELERITHKGKRYFVKPATRLEVRE